MWFSFDLKHPSNQRHFAILFYNSGNLKVINVTILIGLNEFVCGAIREKAHKYCVEFILADCELNTRAFCI